jgi:hypothetical protein
MLSPTLLDELSNSWPLREATTDGTASLLRTSRALFVHSYFVYEFLALGVLVSFQAVESALRDVLGTNATWNKLVLKAESEGLIDSGQAEHLHAARMLRNTFSHPSQQTVWPHGMASMAIETSHVIVAELTDARGASQ